MESNPNSAALAQQVQALAATIVELTKQNQEMKLRLQQVQQEENRSKGNSDEEGDGRTEECHHRSVDRMVRATDSPFTTTVLECLVPSKFRLPQL